LPFTGLNAIYRRCHNKGDFDIINVGISFAVIGPDLYQGWISSFIIGAYTDFFLVRWKYYPRTAYGHRRMYRDAAGDQR
jgi:hypothetical protein